MSRCPEEFVRFADRLADAAGELQRRHYRKSVAVEIKADGSPVTQVDRETERVLRNLIEQHHPNHGISGEEYPDVRAEAEYVWVLDPLDGTKSFLAGMPFFGILIGLARRGRFVLGVMDQPVLRDRWIGADGHGTMFNGNPAHVRPCPTLREAVAFLGKPYDPAIARLNPALKWARYGGDCYAYGLLASGYVDLVVDNGLGDHDFGALEPIVRNAGGVMTDWEGRALTMASGGAVLACGDAVLADAVRERLHAADPLED